MTTIQYAGNVSKEALAMTPVAVDLLRLNLESFILAKESGTTPGGLSAFDLDAPRDNRIVWTEAATDEGVTVTGTLEVQP